MNKNLTEGGQEEDSNTSCCDCEEAETPSNGDPFALEINTHDVVSQEDAVYPCCEEPETLLNGDPSVLEVNVHDAISQKDVGPGQ